MKRSLYLILLLLYHAAAISQTQTFRGTIKNGQGEPVPFATVRKNNGELSVVANEEGVFVISAAADSKLTITASGYETVVLTAGNAGNVQLNALPGQLSEVVVVAYGTQRRTNVTGSVVAIAGAELENKPFSSVDKSLQGMVAGLQSTSASGAPGSATDVRIRGVGSITAGSSPLYVIDGVIATAENAGSAISRPFNVLSTLNPNDIENITVLKDAAAQSIYGSRAANGVILINTKKGKAGRSRLEFSTELGKSSQAFRPDNRPLTTAEYQELMRESIINAGYAADDAGADAIITDASAGLGLPATYTQTATDWMKEVTRTAPQQQYNLSLSGGNDKTQIFASGGFFRQNGVIVFSDYKRYNGSLSVKHRLSDRASFSSGLNLGYTSQHTPANSGYWQNPVYAAISLPPWYAPRNADGTPKIGDADNQFPLGAGPFNPVVVGDYQKARNQQTTFRGYASGEVLLVKGLKLTSRYSGEFFNIQEDQYYSPLYGDGYGLGDGTGSYRRIFNWTWSNYLDYHLGLNKSGDVYTDIKAGYEAQALNNYVNYTSATNFPSNTALQNLVSASTPYVAYTNTLEQSSTGLFSLGSINYKNRYVLSGSFRRDASSVFGAAERSGNFYSAGASWNINEEEFIRTKPAISLLKLRASFGENGNQSGINYYSSQATFNYGINYVNGLVTNNNYAGRLGSSLNSVGNPDLTWERNAIANIGLDFGLWKNRLFGTLEWYTRNTTNLLLQVPLSQTAGVDGQIRNVGAMTNKGIEITLGGSPVLTKDFSWTITGNFARNTNRITHLPDGKPIPAGFFNYTEGHSLYEFNTRIWAGVDPANGDPLWYTNEGKETKTNDATAASFVLTGLNALPKFFGSVTNSFTFHGITFDAQFYYNYGNHIAIWYAREANSDGALYGAVNQMSDQLQRWQKAGDVTNTPRVIIGGNKLSNRNSTRFLYSGDFIRLRNLQLSYPIAPALLKKVGISTATIYARGTNLLTFAKDRRLPVDPEQGITSQADLDVLIPKTITAGIKIAL